MSLSFSRTKAHSPKIKTQDKADVVSFLSTVRLMLPKIGVGYLFAMLLSVYNRVMINELKIGATLVGLMLLTYNLMSVLQVINGRMSDRRHILGYRRTPYLFAGLMVSSLALVNLPSLMTSYAEGNNALLPVVFLVMAIFGFGFAMTGDAHNALIAEQTEGKKNRGTVVAAVWVFTILSSIICAIVASIILATAEKAAGAPKGCITNECLQIKHGVALALMPKLFMAGPLVALLGFLPLLGLERRLTRADINALPIGKPLDIKQAFTRIFTNAQSRVFFFFVFVSIFGLFLQDDILEPFGADVFKLPASSTSQFQPIMGGTTILTMLVVGFISGKFAVPKRTIANIGAVMSAAGFMLLALAAFSDMRPALYAGMVVLGAGMGTFNIGALSMMMDMTVPGETGSLMGAWGMAQAVATGSSQFVAGFMRDAGIAMTGSYALSYGVIFCTSVVLCIVAVNLMAKVDVQKFRSMTREQLGLVMEAA